MLNMVSGFIHSDLLLSMKRQDIMWQVGHIPEIREAVDGMSDEQLRALQFKHEARRTPIEVCIVEVSRFAELCKICHMAAPKQLD